MNKRRFKKTLKQNAIYYKVKRVLNFTAPGSTDQCRMGINFNGKENPTIPDNESTALWYQTEVAPAESFSLGDLPDLTNQYDQNRLAGVSLKWYPGLPPGSILGQYSPMAIAWDRDGIEGNVLTQDLPTLMEQVNGVTVKNAYRPWKKYFKAPKYKLNTRVPSMVFDPSSGGSTYGPNENLAGQWKRVGEALAGGRATFSPMSIAKERGTHLLVTVEAPSIEDPGQLPAHVGTMVITSYFVYKDRR